jgi:hypothetical protein
MKVSFSGLYLMPEDWHMAVVDSELAFNDT